MEIKINKEIRGIIRNPFFLDCRCGSSFSLCWEWVSLLGCILD